MNYAIQCMTDVITAQQRFNYLRDVSPITDTDSDRTAAADYDGRPT